VCTGVETVFVSFKLRVLGPRPSLVNASMGLPRCVCRVSAVSVWYAVMWVHGVQ
jgi:hypothetical protein